MTPSSIKEAQELGWRELDQEEVRALRSLHPNAGLDNFAAGVDCNFAQEGAPCGGFGGLQAVACFCRNGLCVCFQQAGIVGPG